MAKAKQVGEATQDNAEIRAQIKAHILGAENEHWELSRLLATAYGAAMYTGWGYASWKEYVEKELDFAQRKAEYHLSVGKWFAELPPKAQDWAQKLGFSKCRLITGIVKAENIAEWRQRLDGKSFREIEALMKGERERGDGDGDGDTGGDADGETDPNKAKNWSCKLFPAQLRNVEQAVGIAQGMAESDKKGHALDLICTDFLATNGGIETVQDYLQKVEKATGVSLVAYDRSEDAVVYGARLIQELREKKTA